MIVVGERAQPVSYGVKVIKRDVLAQGARYKEFEYSKIDLIAIKKMFDNDSYCQTAVNKYVELIFKRGWYLDSSNADAKRYISNRLLIMYKSTGIRFDDIIRDITLSLVLYANAYVKKTFRPTAEASVYTPVKHRAPDTLVGLFTMHPASMYVKRDKYNNVLKWQQRDIGKAVMLYDGTHHIPEKPEDRKRWPTYWPEDIIHIYINREPGYIFGFSTLHTVLEDITALRAIEEHSSRLIYRDLFPLYHARVGLQEIGLGASREEVNEVKETIGNLSYDSVLVTNERVDVDVIGSKGEAIDPSPTLKYFENRCFTGLNVSPVQMGRDTSNRATADALTSEMHDRAEAFQNRVSAFAETLFDLILLEGGYDITDEANKVYLKFPEIELETVIKQNNNTIQKWLNNTITMSEMRRELGHDPLTEEEINELFFNIVKVDSSQNAAQDNLNQPENQYKKRTGPKRDTETYKFVMQAILNAINYNELRNENIEQKVREIEMRAIVTISSVFNVKSKDMLNELKVSCDELKRICLSYKLFGAEVFKKNISTMINNIYERIERSAQ